MPTLSRTQVSGRAYDLEPEGRATQLDKIYVGFVKANNDAQRMGRLKVWIPEVSGDPTDESQWFTCSYSSPFAGATSVYDNTNGPNWDNSQRSYGFWFVPPDLENEVLCCFINGDPGRGIWFGCLYQQNMDHMVPGIPGDETSNGLPVSEYNKLKANVAVDTINAPVYTPLAAQLQVQGLDKDTVRGTSTAGARRNDPINAVYGMLTPGGTQIVFDDNPLAKFIRLRTQQGTQITINDTDGFIYMITRDGNSWMELGNDGAINVYGSSTVSIRSEGTLNLKGDIDVNIEAGRSIYMKARGQVTSTLVNAQSDANPNSGQIVTAQTTNTSQVPYISNTSTTASITVPTNNITGQFVSGMSITGIPWSSTNQKTTTTYSPNVGVNTSSVHAPGTGPNIGVSNNNPGNIRDGAFAQSQPGYVGGASGFATFASPQDGANAQVALLNSYHNSGYTNISSIVNRWAPAGDGGNNPSAYANIVSQKTGIGVNDQIPSDQLPRVAAAMSSVEIGQQNADMFWSQNPSTTVPATADTNTNSATSGNTVPVTNNLNTSTPTVVLQSTALNESGNLTTLTVTFGLGNECQGSNAAVIIGTLQNDTSNVSVPTTNNTSVESGMIMINANKDMHLTSNRDMYIRSDGLMSRTAKKNMFDWAYGSYDLAVGGYLTVDSNGLLSLGTANNIVLGGARIDLNGPTPAAAKEGPDAKQPIDTQLKNSTVVSPGVVNFDLFNTILSQLPTHEPFDGHAATAPGFNNHVETGSSVDPYTGQPFKPGQVVGGQSKPLDLQGSPNANSDPGVYKGQGYDNNGQPVYSFSGTSKDLAPAGTYRTSQAGAEFIARFEGKRSQVYLDIAGLPTIGIGHLLLPDERAGNYVTIGGQKRTLNSALTEAEVFELFKQDLLPREQKVAQSVHANITQTQFDMLVSFTYNIGNCNSIAAILNTGSFNVTEKWMSYCHAGGKVIPGLQNRRRVECTNFCNGSPINSGGN